MAVLFLQESQILTKNLTHHARGRADILIAGKIGDQLLVNLECVLRCLRALVERSTPLLLLTV
jgi:hypothetical protein